MKVKNIIIAFLTAIVYLQICLSVNHICYQIYVSTITMFGLSLAILSEVDRLHAERMIKRKQKEVECMLFDIGEEEKEKKRTVKNYNLKKEDKPQ